MRKLLNLVCMATFAYGLAWNLASCGGKGKNIENDVDNNEEEKEVNLWEGYCPDNNHPHAIDLGLPSGTKWACCNIGAKQPSDWGEYFAWGETSPKEDYQMNTYKWKGSNENQMLKYDDNDYSPNKDGKNRLEPEDDAAHVNWGDSWQIPTVEQAVELVTNIKSKWTTCMDVEGLKLTAANGNAIFLPFSHHYFRTELYSQENEGRYWLSDLDKLSSQYACHMWINPVLNIEGGHGIGGIELRYAGLTVRAATTVSSPMNE